MVATKIGANPVVIGDATEKGHYDDLYDGLLWCMDNKRQGTSGLRLRTHPDVDQAAAKVYLDHADEITLDDGETVATWDDLSASLASAGAGGLDTGAEAASTWYQVYAIRKSSDGTKNLLLHRAKYYLKDEEQATNNAYTDLRDAAARTKLAQGFQIDTAGPCPFVDLLLKLQAGAIPAGGYVWVEIQTDTAGAPSGTILATSDKLDATEIQAGSAVWVRFPFRVPATLAASTQYHLVLQASYAVAGGNYLGWAHATSDAYATRGQLAAFDGATWTGDANKDFCFREWVTENDTSVTMPAGYDEKCLIGWAYNDAGSNLLPFVAQDRHVTRGHYAAGAFTAAAVTNEPEFISLAAHIPPVPLRLELMGTVSVAGATAVFSAVPDISKTGYGPAVALLTTIASNAAAWVPLQTDFQGIYGWATDAATATVWVWGYTW